MNPTYTYKDISLVPRKLSEIHSRDDVDLSQIIVDRNNKKRLTVSLPVIPSPMETIATVQMAEKLDKLKVWSTIHRFMSDENRIEVFCYLLKNNKFPPLVSIGVGKNEFKIISLLADLGCSFYNIDIANGFNSIVKPTINYIREICPDAFIMCGNVASRQGFQYLADIGIDCVRVGVGNGSVCSTSQKTSIGQGIASSVIECVEEKQKYNYNTMILADGGASNPGDIGKALGLGANLIMTGNLFSGVKESGGEIIKYNNEKFKIYRGSASFGAQTKIGKEVKFEEGGETLVKYKSGGVEKVIYDIKAGLKSSFSYMGAKNIEEYQENSKNNFVCYHLDQKLF